MYTRQIEVSGDCYQRGVQIGRQLQDAILTNYKNQQEFYRCSENFDYQKWEQLCQRYVPAMQRWTPEVLEELKGMAQGAQLPFQTVLALATAYEKSFGRDCPPEKCTSFFVTGAATGGRTIAGQTNDENLREWRHERDVVIHHKGNDGSEILTYTHPGVPAYMGLNNRGLTVLWTYIDNGKTGDGVPTSAIIRHLLSLSSIEEAVRFLEEVPHDIPNQFGLADKNGKLACVECFPNRVYTVWEKESFVHTNHNVYALEEPDCTTGKTTRDRLAIMRELIARHHGEIDVETAKEFLASHEKGTHSICVHPNSERPFSKTLAVMVFDVDEGVMHIAFGNPCEVPYQTYHFDHYQS